MPTWNEEHLEVVRKGADAIRKWRREHSTVRMKLAGANLAGADMERANLASANLSSANLSSADLAGANLDDADLAGADLSYANLMSAELNGARMSGARLTGALLSGADLRRAILINAQLASAQLSDADLSGADLSGADLTGANLSSADLCSAFLIEANLTSTRLDRTDFEESMLENALFARCELSKAKNLPKAVHLGPSVLDITVLRDLATIGYRPWVDEFLRKCGYSRWEVRNVRLHDPALEDHEIADLTTEIYGLRSEGPLVVGGAFISYSGQDSFALADRIYKRFRDRDTPCWLDKHKALAGQIGKQLRRGIRLHDNVILILSEASLRSTWVNLEIEHAQKKAADQARDVLCPIAIDDSWKSPPAGSLIREDLLTYLTGSYHVLDFSDWKNSFDELFEKLWQGLSIFYERQGEE